MARMEKNTILLNLASVWDIIRDACRNYSRNSDTNQAAAIAFYAILSLVPLVLLTLVVAGYFFGSHPEIQKDITDSIRMIHPYFSDELLNNISVLKKNTRFVGGIGLLSLLWLSAMIFGALEKALNIIFRARTFRNVLTSKLLSLSMVPLGWLIAVASFALSYIAMILQKQARIFNQDAFLAVTYSAAIHYLLPYVLAIVFVALIYKITPTVKIGLRTALLGALAFVTMLALAKYAFSWYVVRYTHYDVIFGTMEAVVMLVVWVFYLAIMLLFCAELISSYERRDMILLEDTLLSPKRSFSRSDERLLRKFGRLYNKDEYLFKEGDIQHEMFYILSGRVGIEKKSGHVTRILARMGPGAYLGEMAALIDAPRTASARALEESHIAIISGDILRNLLRESDAVSLRMLQEFSLRIKNTSDDLEHVTQSWMKLLTILYFLKEWPMASSRDPRQELALLSDKPVTDVDEMFSWLTQEGILAIQDHRIVDFRKERAWEFLLVPNR